MDLYLPIAGVSVNALFIVALGGLVGILSGMFGIGGGFLTTPLLIFYGIPPAVAVASATTQITGASVSGVLAHTERGGVDFRMGWVLVVGGLVGTAFGAWAFAELQASGQIDTAIGLLYVLLLGSIGTLMAREAMASLGVLNLSPPASPRSRRSWRWVHRLPFRWRFHRSGLFISPVAPLLLGTVSGMLTVLLGIGGGFIVVPAMIYLLGMTTRVVVGTSLIMILFVTAATTLVHAVTTRSVDIVLAGLLLLGSVVGAQWGARFAQRADPSRLRLALAVLVLMVALRMLLGLTWRPDEVFTVEAL